MESEIPRFQVAVLGIVFDAENKKFLIGKKNKDSKDAESLGWCFPGGRLLPGEDIDRALKRQVEAKTGYSVKNIGTFFSRTYEEKPEVVSIFFLTKVFEGEEKPGDDLVELKWATLKEMEQLFKIPMHKKLKEFLEELI